ncbi:DUF3397 family protein [Niallia circulans]
MYIVIFILLIGMLFVIVHWKFKEEIQYKKVFKGIWRVSFLLFSFYILYCSFMVFSYLYGEHLEWYNS